MSAITAAGAVVRRRVVERCSDAMLAAFAPWCGDGRWPRRPRRGGGLSHRHGTRTAAEATVAAEHGGAIPPEELARRTCQAAIARAGRKWTATSLKAEQLCRDGILRGKVVGEACSGETIDADRLAASVARKRYPCVLHRLVGGRHRAVREHDRRPRGGHAQRRLFSHSSCRDAVAAMVAAEVGPADTGAGCFGVAIDVCGRRGDRHTVR